MIRRLMIRLHFHPMEKRLRLSPAETGRQIFIFLTLLPGKLQTSRMIPGGISALHGLQMENGLPFPQTANLTNPKVLWGSKQLTLQRSLSFKRTERDCGTLHTIRLLQVA